MMEFDTEELILVLYRFAWFYFLVERSCDDCEFTKCSIVNQVDVARLILNIMHCYGFMEFPHFEL